MDAITQLLMGSYDFALNANFICNIFVLSVFLEFISVFVANCSAIGRQIIMMGLIFAILFFIGLWFLADFAEKYYTGQLYFKKKKKEDEVQ